MQNPPVIRWAAENQSHWHVYEMFNLYSAWLEELMITLNSNATIYEQQDRARDDILAASAQKGFPVALSFLLSEISGVIKTCCHLSTEGKSHRVWEWKGNREISFYTLTPWMFVNYTLKFLELLNAPVSTPLPAIRLFPLIPCVTATL